MSIKKTMRIGDFCRKMIMDGNKSPKQIIAKAKKKFPKSKIDKKHVAWHLWDLKKKGEEVPKLND